MRKTNTATWTKGKDGRWQLLVTFQRHWEAPDLGQGLGTRHQVVVHKKGERNGGTPTQVELTSRVFRTQGDHKAFAQEVRS